MKAVFLPLALAAGTLLLTAQQCSVPHGGKGGKGGAGSPAPDAARLQRTWLHSHEEDHGDTIVYRPNTYAFPPSRGRTGFQIEAGGNLTQFDIAPTDGLEGHKGKWRLEGDTFYATFPDKSSVDYKLRILKLDEQKGMLEAVRTFMQQ